MGRRKSTLLETETLACAQVGDNAAKNGMDLRYFYDTNTIGQKVRDPWAPHADVAWAIRTNPSPSLPFYPRPSVTVQALTAGCVGRNSQNSAEAHVAPTLGWDAATVSPFVPQPAQEHPPRMQPSPSVSHLADARHMALGGA